jgi:hypothetical protein
LVFPVALLLFLAEAKSQITIVNPNISNSVTEMKTPVPKQVAFRLSPFSYPVYFPANATIDVGTEINLGVKEFDLGNNISGNNFVAPENGIYHFDVRMTITYPVTDYEEYQRFYLMLKKNGASVETTILMNPQTTKAPFHTLAISTTLMLMKGDVIGANFNADANSSDKSLWATDISFSGFKVNTLGEGAGSSGAIK